VRIVSPEWMAWIRIGGKKLTTPDNRSEAQASGRGLGGSWGRYRRHYDPERTAYCAAVLAHAKRINLDGSASDEEVDDKARTLAKERLAVLASRPTNAEKPRRPLSGASTAARRDSHKVRIWNVGLFQDAAVTARYIAGLRI
jgi:hypothetical protein